MLKFKYYILFFGLSLSLQFQGLLAQTIIINHNHTDITTLSESRINYAKSNLHIAYGHTSHGSQLTTGMSGLVGFANGGGKGLSLPTDIFAWNNGGTDGALDLHDYAMGGDVGYYPQWYNNTVSYLENPSNSDVNVIIWSWCGQVDSKYAAGTLQSEYLAPMDTLERLYPNVSFVYMTGHLDHWDDGNNKAANQMIRDYCNANDKILYDFSDIESYDPDGTYFEYAHDNCDYYAGLGGSAIGNWATEWRSTHKENVDWYSCSSAHSDALNANQKAYAAWWLWALIAERDFSLAVQMCDFHAVANAEMKIEIFWKTASELDCIGFHVWRSEFNMNHFLCLTESIIPGQGNSSCGAEYSYIDSDILPDVNYEYKVEVVSTNGNIEKFGPIMVKGIMTHPNQLRLFSNYPNPFNPDTYITYAIPESGHIKLSIFDVKGREVRILYNGIHSAGIFESHWDGRDARGIMMPSGIYYTQLGSESGTTHNKMMLLK